MSGTGASSSSSSKSPKAGVAGPSNRKLKVLIVDDDDMVGRMYERLLERYNVETHRVLNGKLASSRCRKGETFDIIFMDQEMPLFDGCKATKELRDLGVKSMIVGMSSKNSSAADLQAFKDAGLDDCIEKPLSDYKIKAFIVRVNSKNAASTSGSQKNK